MSSKTLIVAMTDKELPGYFEEHSKTDRARFHRLHIKQLWELAGMRPPRNVRNPTSAESDFVSMPYTPRLQAIIDIARERVQEVEAEEAMAWDGPLY